MAATVFFPFLGRSAALRANLVAVIGGEISAVSTDGRLFFVAVGHRVVVVDPLQPKGEGIVGETDPFAAAAKDLVVWNERLIVVNESLDSHILGHSSDPSAGMMVYDISNPHLPKIVGSGLTAGAARRVYRQSSLLFVLDDASGVSIFELDSSGIPIERSVLPLPGLEYMAMTGDYLWQYSSGGCPFRDCPPSQPRLVVYDIARPARPELVRVIAIDDRPSGLLGVGAVLLFGGNQIDTRGASADWRIEQRPGPELVNVFNTKHRRWAIYRNRERSLMLAELETSREPAPTFRNPIAIPEAAENGRAGGDWFVWPEQGGLRYVNLSQPKAPAISEVIEFPSMAASAFVTGDGKVGFVRNRAALLAIDLPASVESRTVIELGRSLRGGQATNQGLAMSEEKVIYMAHAEGGADYLRSLKVDDPKLHGGNFDTSVSGRIEQLSVDGDLLLVTERRGDMNCGHPAAGLASMWDLTEPARPRQVGVIRKRGTIGVAIGEETGYLVGGDCDGTRLFGFHIANSIAPRLHNWSMRVPRLSALHFLDDHLIVSGSGQMQVLATHGEDLPELVYSADFYELDRNRLSRFSFNGMLQSNGRLLFMGGDSGIAVISMEDFSSPRLMTVLPVPHAHSISLADHRLFAASLHGIWIFDLW